MGSEARAYFLLLLLTVTASAMPLSQLYEAYCKDFYWTNVNMKLPYDAGKNYFEMYVRNESLKRCLEKKRLGLIEGNSTTPLTAGDLSIRLNRKCEMTVTPIVFSTASVTAAMIFSAMFFRSVWKNKKRRND
jgi:hypothetical protein